jgi:diguanylate cyclase (GGDEF)-like protein/PAS domain S-box-containing protein
MNLSYAIALSISTLISIGVVFTVWHRRGAPGASGLMMSTLAMAIWTLTYAIRWSVSELTAQYFWLDATYFGVVTLPYFLTVFALQSTHREHLLTRRNLLLLAIEPVLTLLLLWTDNLHGLFYAGMRSTGTILNGGPWFWIHVTYSYSIYLVMVVFFAWEYRHASHLYRRQIGTILIGFLLPWVGNVISFSKILPFKNLDITPFVFILSGLVFAYGLFRHGLMDIVPVAQSKLIEHLQDGMLVLDTQQRIVEINPAACIMTGVSLEAIGKPAGIVLAHWPELVEICHTPTEMQKEMRVSQDPPCDIEVRVMSLLDQHQNPNGMLILLRDITERKRAEDELHQAKDALEQALIRVQQLARTDALTGIHNRGYLIEVADRELEVAARYQQPLSVMMIDIDEFKHINDIYGHAMGDQALKKTTQNICMELRASDGIGRYGGDEFIILLPHTNAQEAVPLAERIHAQMAAGILETSKGPLRLSISIGIAQTLQADTIENLFLRADQALYAAKQAGKNCSVIFDSIKLGFVPGE